MSRTEPIPLHVDEIRLLKGSLSLANEMTLRLLEQRDAARMNARIWFCCFCVVSALWVLREVAR